LTEISVLPYAGFLGICLGFVTESNKPFIRFGVTGPILKSTTEVTKKIKKSTNSQKNIKKIKKSTKLPKKIKKSTKKIKKSQKKNPRSYQKIKKSTKKIKKSTNSNFGFHIGYSAAEIRMNFVRRTDRYKSSFVYRGRTLGVSTLNVYQPETRPEPVTWGVLVLIIFKLWYKRTPNGKTEARTPSATAPNLPLGMFPAPRGAGTATHETHETQAGERRARHRRQCERRRDACT
jgi:hypothetical protein